VQLKIAEFSLVIVVGAVASGKSEFIKRNFTSDEIFSIPHTVDVDELDQRFEQLKEDIKRRLYRVESVVIDAPFYFERHRKLMTDLAFEYGADFRMLVFHISITDLRKLTQQEELFTVKVIIGHMRDLVAKLPTDRWVFKTVEETQELTVDRDGTSPYISLDWAKEISSRYEDYGRSPTEPAGYWDDISHQLDLEFATDLVLNGKGTDDIIRTALPELLRQISRFGKPDELKHVIVSSKNWLLDEQQMLKNYFLWLWIELQKTVGAFDQWEWMITATSFLNSMENHERYLIIWGRKLKSNSKSSLFHLVNTLVDHFEYHPKLWDWLKQPFIHEILESSFFRYDGTKFGERISMAEHRLRELKSKD